MTRFQERNGAVHPGIRLLDGSQWCDGQRAAEREINREGETYLFVISGDTFWISITTITHNKTSWPQKRVQRLTHWTHSAEREGFALDPKGRFHKAKRLKERENPDRIHKKSNPCGLLFLAEREGFEPPVPLSTVVFKTTVIDHSTISPVLRFLEIGCKGTAILWINQILKQLFCYFDRKWVILHRDLSK